MWGCYLRAFTVPMNRGTVEMNIYGHMEACLGRKASLFRVMFGRHWNANQDQNEQIVRLNNWQ
jgi:hypothetical protein